MNKPDLTNCKTTREMILVMSESMFIGMETIHCDIKEIKEENKVQNMRLKELEDDNIRIHTGIKIIKWVGSIVTATFSGTLAWFISKLRINAL